MTTLPQHTGLLLLLLVVAVTLTRGYPSHVPSEVAHEPGDINLAILLGHRTQACGGGGDRGYFHFSTRLLYGILYHVERVNRDTRLLPHHKLGYVAYDTCLNPVVAAAQSVRFMPHPQQLLTNDTREPRDLSQVPVEEQIYQRVVAVIGPHTSDEARAVYSLLEAFQLPAVSLTATSAEMSRHRNFFRVVPNDNIQGEAVVRFVTEMRWSCVSLVFADNAYGRPLAKYMTGALEAAGVCVTVSAGVSTRPDGDAMQGDVKDAVRTLIKHANTDVVIAALTVSQADVFVRTLAKYEEAERFTIIGTEAAGWAQIRADDAEKLRVLSGSFVMLPYGDKLGDDYLTWFGSVTYEQVVEGNSPFLKYFWQEEFSCILTEAEERYWMEKFAGNPCQTYHNQTLADSPNQIYRNAPNYYTHDVVYALAFALHAAVREECAGAGEEVLQCLTGGDVLVRHLREVQFESPGTGTVAFDENGDRLASYGIYNIQRSGDTAGLQPQVGAYSGVNDTLTVDESKILWRNGKRPEGKCGQQPCVRGCRFG